MTERSIDRLLQIMARLRDPEGGCPWDIEQNFASIAPYTIEEAYEVADAIERGDFDDLRDELGDLLLQVVFHAQMAKEEGRFEFDDVVEAISDKLVRRHPHVFADIEADTPEAVSRLWEANKAEERAAKAPEKASSVLDGVTLGLPALMRAEKLQKRAARVGFDWPDASGADAKIDEELAELRAEMTDTPDPERLEAELGDLLFATVNLARHIGVDPETALRGASARFEQRFRHVEQALSEQGRSAHDADLAELDRLWDKAKLDTLS